MLAISDERNCNRLHQQHRHNYAIKIKKKRNQTSSRYSTDFTTQTRAPARSWKRKESILLQDDDDDEVEFDDWCDYDLDNNIKYTSYFKPPTKASIQSAIRDEDVVRLHCLLGQLRISRDSNRNLPNRYHRRRKRPLHTLLTYAINYGNSDCIKMLLQFIASGSISSTMIEQVCSNGRTALWYACSKGDLNIVQQLVERARAKINKCGVLIVAAQNGHEHIVKYLLHRGCDPNRHVKNYNERALHAAARRNHLEIVNALLKHGADPTIFDCKKRTALDYAIHKRHIDIAKVLIHHQDGRFIMSQAGFTPLMLATHCNNKPIIDILSKILSHQQYLDELVLLACNYTIYGNTSKRDQAYCYFEKALSMNTPSINTTSYEAYEFRCECQTLDELALIREDDNAMRIYALLVSERLLLRSNQVKHFLSLIMKQSEVYRRHESLHRCLQLRLHAYRLVMQTEDKDWRNGMLYKSYLPALVSILFQILQKEDAVPIESLALVWTWILNRADNQLTKFLFKLIFITTYVSKKINGKEQRILFGLVQRTLRQKFTMRNGHFLFTHCIVLRLTGLKYFTIGSIRIPALSVIQLLIECGANVNEAHLKTKSTPLHRVSWTESIYDARFFINLLLDANAHTDCIDMYGRLPENCAYEIEIKELLQANRKLSLKCRCAQLIVSENVCYKNSLSSHLIDFIRMHDKY